MQTLTIVKDGVSLDWTMKAAMVLTNTGMQNLAAAA